MKRILSIALGELSTGELIIADSFTKSLDLSKYSIDYLIPIDKEGFFDNKTEFNIYTISPSHEAIKNQRKIISLIRINNYDLIILFDAFTMEYAQNWTGINMDILKTLNIPIASLDEYNYIDSGYKLDYYGIFVKRLPDLLSKVDIIFKNCPLSMPNSEYEEIELAERKGQFYYQAISKTKRLDEDRIYSIRKKYVKDNEKIVFLTLSKWELDGAYSFSSQSTLCRYLLPLIYNYLTELDLPICLIHVGASCWKEPQFKNPNINYIHYNSLPIDTFEEILQSSDLFITYNLVSITLTKAIELGVNSIVLNNDKIIDFKSLEKKCKEKPLWYQNMAKDIKKVYPFTASMFGWNHFLKYIIKENIYMDTFKRVQAFNTEKVLFALDELLYSDSDMRLTHKIKEFKVELSKVPNANKALDKAFYYLIKVGRKGE